MPKALAPVLAEFLGGAAASLVASHLLTSRLERLGGRFSLSEALLGLVTALAADSPEITSSVSAMQSGRHTIGISVVLGSNVFNIAALLGLGAIVAGRVHLHRDVVALEGIVAAAVAAVAVAVAAEALPATVGLGLCLLVVAGYALAIGLGSRRLRRAPLPRKVVAFLDEAACDECLEIGPPETAPAGTPAWQDGGLAALALVVVVVASVLMERTGVSLGARAHLPAVVTGGLVLAAVTSLPNAVAAVYLARRGRGAAVLSEAMNSNALNVTAGLLVPGVLVGLGALGEQAVTVAAWYAGLTVAVLSVAFLFRGINRAVGVGIVAAYAVFVALLLA